MGASQIKDLLGDACRLVCIIGLDIPRAVDEYNPKVHINLIS